MAIINEMTDAGETLRADNVANGTTSQVTRIEADMGHVTTAALARALTDVVIPFVPVRETTNPQGRALASDPVAQFRYLDAAAVNYNIVGFGIFAGNVMTHYICDDAGATIYPKTAGLILDVVLYIVAESGDQATFTFSDDLVAPLATEVVPGLLRKATDAEADATEANALDTVVPTMAKVWRWWNNAITKLLLRTRLGMATAQQARAGSGDGVMTAELTSEAVGALAPNATSDQVRATLGGTDPASAIEDNTLTLQALFDSIKAYEDGNLPNAVPENGTIEIVYET